MHDNNPLVGLFHKSENYFFKAISKCCLNFGNIANAYFTGVHASNLNPVIIRQDTPSIDTIFHHARELYDTNECPWEVVVPESLDSGSIKRGLYSISFHTNEKSAAMFMKLSDQKPFDQKSLLEIRNTNHHLSDWGLPLIKAFESTSEIAKQYITAHERAMSAGAEFHHFTAYEDNIPVSSITISIDQKIVRIDDLGTDPQYQNKGYATHLMNHALLKASALGATHCFLEASNAGLSLYQKLGFVHIFTKHIYSKK